MDDGGYREVGYGEVSEFGVLCEFPCLLYDGCWGRVPLEEMRTWDGVPRKREG
jgi:hypothetical protein